jgi:decaprenylphospho-beta-D-ribofuranose 2-oxidase
MANARLMQISGWGNVPRQSAQVFRPEKWSENRATVAAPQPAQLIARGLGRSYGDAAIGEGIVLQTRLDRFLSFDPQTGILECEGGTPLADVLDVLLPRGFFPPVTPGTKFVTLGGAIAADVHGKNHHRDGSIAEFVESFELLIADGQTLHCSREQNADAFWATLGGMGLTGIILSCRLRLRPVETAYIAVDYQRAANLDEALALFAHDDEKFQYSVAWIDCLASGAAMGRSVLMRGNHATVAQLPPKLQQQPLHLEPKRKKSVPFNFPSFALSPLTVRLFNNRYYKRSRVGQHIVDYDAFFYPLDSVLHWNRIYGKRGFFQYQAVFPASGARECLLELLGKLSSSGRASFLAVLKTMGKSSGGILSFPMPGQTLALDIPNSGPQTIEFLRELDQIVLRFGGRVYLAKDAAMTKESFRAMYPRLSEFEQVRAKLDPSGRFASAQSRRLEIGLSK